jgi:hypothetical protein
MDGAEELVYSSFLLFFERSDGGRDRFEVLHGFGGEGL